MISQLKELLFGETADDDSEGKDALQLAAAALLIEAATVDGQFDAEERDIVTTVLRDRFALTEAATGALIEAAERRVESANQSLASPASSKMVCRWKTAPGSSKCCGKSPTPTANCTNTRPGWSAASPVCCLSPTATVDRRANGFWHALTPQGAVILNHSNCLFLLIPCGAYSMAYVVTENCIKCKFMDCVEVCPVDCFYEGENMLVINPDECIDCGVCEPECPAEAIMPESEPGIDEWITRNREYSQDKGWPNITRKGEPAPDAEEWKGKAGKRDLFSEKPGAGD